MGKERTDLADAPQAPPPSYAPPAAARAPEPVRTGATIGKAVRIIGDVHSEEDLFIDGEIQGRSIVKGSKPDYRAERESEIRCSGA